MNKKISTGMLLGILSIILILGVSYALIGGSGTYATTSSSMDNDYFYAPTFGTLSCEESDGTLDYPSSSSYKTFDSIFISCEQFGSLVDECYVTFKLPSKDEVENKDSFLAYRICEDYESNCNVENLGTKLITRYAYLFEGDEGYNFVSNSIRLKKGQYMIAYYVEGGLTSWVVGADPVKKGKYQVEYNPSYIVRYDSLSSTNGAKDFSTQDCVIDGDIEELNFVVEDVMQGGSLSRELSNEELASANTLRSKDGAVVYASVPVAVPNFVSQTFNGKEAFCYDKTMYAIDSITLSDGKTYRVADRGKNDELGRVECCDSFDAGVGNKCIENKIISFEEAEEGGLLQSCSFDFQCQSEYRFLPGGKSVIEQCINGYCVDEYIEIECSFQEDCNGGICVLDRNDPKKNYCKDPVKIENCGNGYCELSFGENTQTCPADCDPSKKEDDDYLVAILIGAIALMIFAGIAVLMNKKGGSGGDLLG